MDVWAPPHTHSIYFSEGQAQALIFVCFAKAFPVNLIRNQDWKVQYPWPDLAEDPDGPHSGWWNILKDK